MKDDEFYLKHILECIADVQEYTKGGKTSFLSSKLVQDATLRKLQILAESTTRLSNAIKDQHSEVNWRAMRGFRNIVVHDYLNIELEIVWAIVESELPVLEGAVRQLLNS